MCILAASNSCVRTMDVIERWCSLKMGEKSLQKTVYVLGVCRIIFGILHIVVVTVSFYHVAQVADFVRQVREKFGGLTDEQMVHFLWVYLSFGIYYVLSDGKSKSKSNRKKIN